MWVSMTFLQPAYYSDVSLHSNVGKEAKKRMCAGCSRSPWTMKEARTNQIAVCVNCAEVSIHNIALSNDRWYELNGLSKGPPPKPLLEDFWTRSCCFPDEGKQRGGYFGEGHAFLKGPKRRRRVALAKKPQVFYQAYGKNGCVWPLLTPAVTLWQYLLGWFSWTKG